jgi:hypothetical protein
MSLAPHAAPPGLPTDTSRFGRVRSRRWRPYVAAVLIAAFALVGVASRGDPASAGRGRYLLLPRAELVALPTSGAAWNYIVRVAHSAWAAPELDDQDSKTNVQALAAALVYARTGDTAMRAKARHALVDMISTYDLSQDAGLGPARQIAGWVLVADFIGLSGSEDDAFRGLLRRALTHPIGTHPRWGGSLTACQEDSDNNWGAWCASSRVAAALYLGDSSQLGQANRVLRGFLGDRSAWSHFRGQGSENGVLTAASRSWSCDDTPDAYVPTNPACGDRSGAFPADAGRAGTYRTLDAMYQSETTAAVVLATELLYRNGYPHAWAFRGALARIAKFDYVHGAWNLGTVQYHWPWLINRRLGTSYPTVAARYGRSFGYTDWLYGRHRGGGGNAVGTPRPSATTRNAPKPKQTPKPGGGGGGVLASVTASPTAGTTPAPTSAAVAGEAFPGAAPAIAEAQREGGGVTTSMPPGLTVSAASQIVAKLLLAVLIAWAAATAIRTTARRRPARGAPTAVQRRG